jgi:hypothetical protein
MLDWSSDKFPVGSFPVPVRPDPFPVRPAACRVDLQEQQKIRNKLAFRIKQAKHFSIVNVLCFPVISRRQDLFYCSLKKVF